MCKCHTYNKSSGEFERVLGESTLNSIASDKEVFRFSYEAEGVERIRTSFGRVESATLIISNHRESFGKVGGVYHNTARVVVTRVIK